jgi:hypothetical protein
MPAKHVAGARVGLRYYEFNGDSLKICNAPPGKPRPTEVDAKAGSNHLQMVWQPEKK